VWKVISILSLFFQFLDTRIYCLRFITQINLEKIAENLTNKEKKELVKLPKKVGFHAEKPVIS